MRIAIISDIKRSGRVARSNMDAFRMMGADVTLVAPPHVAPPGHVGAPTIADLDEVIDDVDVAVPAANQHKRMTEALVPDAARYTARFGLTAGARRAPAQSTRW